MKKIILLLGITILLACNTLNVYAEEKNDNLPDSEVVEEFDIFTKDISKAPEELLDEQEKSHITYKVTKTGHTSIVGAYTGQSISGEPGVTISLSQMRKTSFSASSNVAANVKGKAQATLGFNFSQSYSIKHSGSRKIPSKHNGRKVKRAELKAYRLYDKYTFKVTWTSIYVRTPQYYGSYWAKKPCGYHYKMIYYYK